MKLKLCDLATFALVASLPACSSAQASLEAKTRSGESPVLDGIDDNGASHTSAPTIVEWKRSEFSGFKIAGQQPVHNAGTIEANGKRFVVDLSPASAPSRQVGSRKFLTFNAGFGKEGEGFFPRPLMPDSPNSSSVSLWAPFNREQSSPPWHTSATPIYFERGGKSVQIGHYRDWNEGDPDFMYHKPVVCDREFAEVCQIDVVTLTPNSPMQNDPYMFNSLVEVHLLLKRDGKWVEEACFR